MVEVNFNINNFIDYKNELEEDYEGYIPLLLLNFIEPHKYFPRQSDEVINEYYWKRAKLPIDDMREYLLNDLLNWIKENPMYKDIIK